MASWILTPPGDLTDDDRAALAQITARCDELKTTRALVREFADMLCHRHGERLEAWASQAESSPVSELRGFSKGLRKDWAAVTAGLTVSYSSGAVEGHVNRIKMIKRQMYGRAKPLPTRCRPGRRGRALRSAEFQPTYYHSGRRLVQAVLEPVRYGFFDSVRGETAQKPIPAHGRVLAGRRWCELAAVVRTTDLRWLLAARSPGLANVRPVKA